MSDPSPEKDVKARPLSVSRLQTMAKCGHDYYLSKILRVPQRTAAWFIQGTAVHAALDAYESSWRALKPDEAVEVFEWHWDADLAAAEEKQPDHDMWIVGGRAKRETDLAKRRNLGRQQVLDYIEANGPHDNELIPAEIVPGEAAVEVGFDLDFNGVRVIGYIDLVLEEKATGRLKVRDIKTGSKVPSDPYQMATYGLAVEKLTGLRVEWGDWWMCKDGKASQPFDLRPYTWEIVAKWYQTADAMIKAGHFLGNPGDGCFTCTSQPYCSYYHQYPLQWPVVSNEPDFS